MEEFNYNQGFQKQQASKILKSYGIDIEKALTHKYFKREGTPGHYKYYYTEADYKAGKSSSVEPKESKKDKINSEAEKIKNALDSGAKLETMDFFNRTEYGVKYKEGGYFKITKTNYDKFNSKNYNK